MFPTRARSPSRIPTYLSPPAPRGVSSEPGEKTSKTQSRQWPLATRIGFRFAAVFLFCTIYPFPFDGSVFDQPLLPWLGNGLVQWVGIHLVSLDRAKLAVSDTEGYLAVRMLTYALVAAVLTVAWSLIDRNRVAYRRLHSLVALYTRFYLATSLLAFGFAKIFPYQFRPPSLARLLQPLGDYEPFALMWAFMGSSTAYMTFAGVMEVVAGSLLLVRRTTTLGALLGLGALANVFAMDVSYNVGISGRTYCFLLILMCGFLLGPELRRLADIFVFNRGVVPSPVRPMFHSRRANQVAKIAQLACAVCVIASAVMAFRRQSHERDRALSRNPLRGIWWAEEVAIDGRARPPLVTDAARWQRVVIDSPPGYENRTVDLVTVQSMSGTLSSFDGTFDLQHNTLELANVAGDSTWRAHFALTRPQTDEVVLDGTYDTHRLHVTLRLTHPRFTLTAARFHWPESAWVDPFNP